MSIIDAYVHVRGRLMRRKIGPADVVLMGGSSVEYWRSSAEDLLPLVSRNFGIGGSTAAQWVHLAADLVLPCMPKAVFVFAGSNDLHMKKEPPESVFAHLRQLFDLLARQLPGVTIYYAGVYLTQRYQGFWAADRRCNALVQAYASGCVNLKYIDLPAALADENGEPLPDIFRKDSEHLNARGYALWRQVIAVALG